MSADNVAEGTLTYFDIQKGRGYIAWEGSKDGRGDVRIKFECYKRTTSDRLVRGEPLRFGWKKLDDGKHVAEWAETPEYRLKGKITDLAADKDYGTITSEDGTSVFFHFRSLLGRWCIRPTLGEKVEYEIERDQRNRNQAVRVKRLDYRGCRHPLEGFANLQGLDENLSKLATTLAQEEEWDYRSLDPEYDPDDEHRDAALPVLRNYIYYIFAHAVELDSVTVANDGSYAAFNTGLLTDNWEQIYGFFTRNKAQSKDGKRWVLDSWRLESDKKLLAQITRLPALVKFHDKNISDFFYDTSCRLQIQKDHIISDERNLQRFPSNMRGDKELCLSALDAAEKRLIDRVDRNYKVAVPQWYKGRVQLLVPLCLRTKKRADLALVVERHGQFYVGETALKIGWAYSNARLICKPESDWLNIKRDQKTQGQVASGLARDEGSNQLHPPVGDPAGRAP